MTRATVCVRSCPNGEHCARARKPTVRTNLSYDEARRDCDADKSTRTTRHIRTGTNADVTQD